MKKNLSFDEQKELVGRAVIDILVKEKIIASGVKIGLGTGTTVVSAIKRLAEYIADGTLKNIAAVSTSFQTTILCESLHIPLFFFNSARINGELFVTIDGMDEVDKNRFLIKGGGAALLQEKLLAYNATQFIVIADERKVVNFLGETFALPIEILPEARVSVIRALEKLGASEVILREAQRKIGPVVTDNGNFILDVRWQNGACINPAEFEVKLNSIPGIIENGFFTQNLPRVFIAYADGVIKEIE